MNNLMVIDGIEVRRDAYGRYSLNDLHRAAVASGAMPEPRSRESFFPANKLLSLFMN